MIAELTTIGNDIVCGVSSGLAPLGIIDDINTKAFSKPVIDEIVFVDPASIGTPVGGKTTHDIIVELANPSIVNNSFVSDYPMVVNFRNGTCKILTGSELNYDSTGSGTLDSIRAIVSYVYQISDIPGDNTTLGSGRITLWFQRGIWQTDQYDTTQGYVLNATLYCGLDGKLTSRQPTVNHPGIAIVTGPPSAISSMIEFLFL